MGIPTDPPNGQRPRGKGFLIVLWSFWLFGAAYSSWSAGRVFPLYAAVPVNGQVTQFSFGGLPIDRYSIEIVVGTVAETKEWVQHLRQSHEMVPMQLTVELVDSRGREVIDYRGSTQHWIVGERPDAVVIYSEIGFEGRLFESYALSISMATENADIRQSQVSVAVVGNRDDGYYPWVDILYLGLAFIALLLLTIARALSSIGRSD